MGENTCRLSDAVLSAHEFPCGLLSSHVQPNSTVFDTREHLQRQFFVKRVDLSCFLPDAVVANVVMITLRPTRAEYYMEIIFRRTSAHNVQPKYFRGVIYHDSMKAPLTQVEDEASTLNIRIVARRRAYVQITKKAFLRLAESRDPSQPAIQKTTLRFFLSMRYLTLVRFERLKEMKGICRLVASVDTTENNLGNWVEVELYSLLTRGVMM